MRLKIDKVCLMCSDRSNWRFWTCSGFPVYLVDVFGQVDDVDWCVSTGKKQTLIECVTIYRLCKIESFCDITIGRDKLYLRVPHTEHAWGMGHGVNQYRVNIWVYRYTVYKWRQLSLSSYHLQQANKWRTTTDNKHHKCCTSSIVIKTPCRKIINRWE